MISQIIIVAFTCTVFCIYMLFFFYHQHTASFFTGGVVQVEEGPFSVPSLPYAYNSLEPFIDQKTMEIHHSRHHKAYVDALNNALSLHPDFKTKSIEELVTSYQALPEDISQQVRNNGGGHYNHCFFWKCMSPSRAPISSLLEHALNENFESLEKFKELFKNKAKTCFGSGWVWLCFSPTDKKLTVTTTSNQDTPLIKGLVPLLALDVWEHAYYLKYNNRRLDYVDAWWHVVDWSFVEEQYKKALAGARQ